MNRTMSLLTSMGLGAGLMYFFDPNRGRQRRALLRDKIIRAGHKAQDARDMVIRDVRNRMHGLASGDLSILVGGKNALRGNPLRGRWSPAGRALLGLIGGGLFLRGLTREAPMACVMGTAGLALMIEGATNAGIEDIKQIPEKVTKIATESISHDGRDTGHRKRARSRMASVAQ